jgi:pSer/pThr/pTyr-binding forkhead associated (FHA) protein
VIGRGPSADVQVDDPELSREHVALTSTLAGIALDDLGSKNGVHVNGQRVVGRVRLEPGDRLALGGTVAVVVDPAAALLEAMDGEALAEARAPAALEDATGTAGSVSSPGEQRPAPPPAARVRRAGSAGLLALAALGALVVIASVVALIRLLG